MSTPVLEYLHVPHFELHQWLEKNVGQSSSSPECVTGVGWKGKRVQNACHSGHTDTHLSGSYSAFLIQKLSIVHVWTSKTPIGVAPQRR